MMLALAGGKPDSRNRHLYEDEGSGHAPTCSEHGDRGRSMSDEQLHLISQRIGTKDEVQEIFIILFDD